MMLRDRVVDGRWIILLRMLKAATAGGEVNGTAEGDGSGRKMKARDRSKSGSDGGRGMEDGRVVVGDWHTPLGKNRRPGEARGSVEVRCLKHEGLETG